MEEELSREGSGSDAALPFKQGSEAVVVVVDILVGFVSVEGSKVQNSI